MAAFVSEYRILSTSIKTLKASRDISETVEIFLHIVTQTRNISASQPRR